MKIGAIPPIPENPDEPWCPFDALEEGDWFKIFNFKGSCPNCEDQIGKYPKEIQVTYEKLDGIYHTFYCIDGAQCSGCGGTLHKMAVMCNVARVDVSQEFKGIKK